MESKYKPRPDIYDHLTSSISGYDVPDCLHIKKPEYDENGLYMTKEDDLIVDIPKLMARLGVANKGIPIPLFLEICEHVIQIYERGDQINVPVIR